MLKSLPIEQVRPNPDKPRKRFDPDKLADLAASIQEQGLIQPITVRRAGHGRYMIVAGERRFRAHKLANLSKIKAHVVDLDDKNAAEQAIIENLQRTDLTPLEEAQAYQKMMDNHGYTPEELAKRLGIKQHWRITERTALLGLQPEYQTLLSGGQISVSQATKMSKLGNHAQDTLFKSISASECENYQALRAGSTALVEAEAQVALFDEAEAPMVDPENVERASRFERKIEQVAQLLNAGIQENEIVAVQKVNPTNAATLADKMAAMQKSLKSIELALRQAGAQASFAEHGE